MIAINRKEMVVDGGELPKGTYLFEDTVVLECYDTIVSAIQRAVRDGRVKFIPGEDGPTLAMAKENG